MSRLTTLLCVAFLGAGCSVNLQHDLTEDDANDIYVLLQNNGVDATKHKEGEGKDARYIISVPKPDVAHSAQLLRDASLPRPKSDGLAIFKMTKGMIPTQTEERAMFIEALGGEVNNALNRIPGVLEAKTIVMIPEVNDLTQPDKKPMPAASVLIMWRPFKDDEDAAAPVPPVSIDDIQAFVANTVPELKKENVKVLLTRATKSARGGDDRLQRFMGMEVAKTSAGTLKAMIGIFGLLFILMSAGLVFLVLRKPTPARPVRTRNTNGPAAEG